jgi:hypothetical protein
MNALGTWVVLAMVFVMVGGLTGFMAVTFMSSVFWAVALGITSGLLAAGVVVWISNREV